ncbi:endo-beta-N-acetylglucosaminidase D [Bradyrhizobium diazoefficiens]
MKIFDDGSLGSQFGTLHLKSGNIKPLSIRDVANKTIHAKKIESVFDAPTKPVLKTTAHNESRENWTHAEIDLNTFAAGCRMMTS